MKATVTFYDSESFTAEEVISNLRRIHGKHATIEVSPESSKPNDLLYFALQNMITQEQLSAFFDNKDTYAKNLQKIRAEILYQVQSTLDNVIVDNETKLTRD